MKAIVKPSGCKGWTTVSKNGELTDDLILAAVSGKTQDIWGCRFGETTRYAVLDVDKGSPYHNAQGLEQLAQKLGSVGLKVIPYRSSESNGWHLYLFFLCNVLSEEVGSGIREWLRAEGFEVKNGVFEVFPSGNGLRLPLQAGFAWLDSKGAVLDRREDLTTEQALRRFLNDLETGANNWPECKRRIESRLEQLDWLRSDRAQAHQKAIDTEGLEPLFGYRLIPEKYQKGREYWQTGLTDWGQRHDAVLAVEHYLWHGDESADVPALPAEHNDEPRYRLILAWLEAKHNGYCNHINEGKWRKVEQQVRRACKWRRPFGAGQVRIPYLVTENAMERLIGRTKATGRTWTPDDLKKGNDGRELEARKKIREALQLLTEQGLAVTQRQLEKLSGCCHKTVKRHSDIWKVAHVISIEGVGGDKNPFCFKASLPAPNASRSSPEKSFLNLPINEDSVDLGCLRDLDSKELAPIEITPPLLLPGEEPSSEPPTSRPSPAGACGSLDAGTPVRRDSGRGADDAGGLEPEPEGSVAIAGMDTVKTQAEEDIQAFDVQSTMDIQTGGNCQNVEETSVCGKGKTLFILPYGSARRPGMALAFGAKQAAGLSVSGILTSQVGQVATTTCYPPAKKAPGAANFVDMQAWSRKRHGRKTKRSEAASGRRGSGKRGQCLYRAVRQDTMRRHDLSRSPPGLIYWHRTGG